MYSKVVGPNQTGAVGDQNNLTGSHPDSLQRERGQVRSTKTSDATATNEAQLPTWVLQRTHTDEP